MIDFFLSVVVKFWLSSEWWYVSKLPRASLRISQLSGSNLKPPSHLAFPRSHSFVPKYLSFSSYHLSWRRPQFGVELHHSEVFIFSRSFSFQKSPTSSQKLQISVHRISTYPYAIIHTFITCNTLFSASIYGKWQSFQPAISTNQHQQSHSFQ